MSNFNNINNEFSSCLICFDSSKFLYEFSCHHKICVICLYRKIFIDLLPFLQNRDFIEIKCSNCEEGKFSLTLEELFIILDKKSEYDKTNNENKIPNISNEFQDLSICKIHQNNFDDIYCLTCHKHICKLCYENEQNEMHQKKIELHLNHNLVNYNKLIKILQSNKKEINLRNMEKEDFIKNLDLLGKKLKENIELNLNNSLDKIDNLIEHLISFRKNYELKYQEIIIKTVKILKLYKLFYLNYYYDRSISDNKDDVRLLQYINSIKFELKDISLNHDKSINFKMDELKLNLKNFETNNNNFLNVNFIHRQIPNSYYVSEKHLKAHEKIISSIIEGNDNNNNIIIFTGGFDHKIKIWKENFQENEFKVVNNITRSTGIISCLLLLNDNRIVCGNKNENHIKIFIDKKNDGKYEIEQTLSAHNKNVNFLRKIYSDKINQFISVSEKEIFVWKENKNKFIKIFNINEENKITFVFVNNENKLFYGLNDGKIKIYLYNNDNNNNNEIFSYQTFLLREFKNKNNENNNNNNNNINEDNINDNLNIQKINENNNQNLNEFYDITFITELKNKLLLSAGMKNFIIYLWKPTSSEYNTNYTCIQTLHGHCAEITSIIELNDDRIISCSRDRTLRIWKTAKLDYNLSFEEHYINDEVLAQTEHGIINLIKLKDGRLCGSLSSNFSLILWRNRKEYC